MSNIVYIATSLDGYIADENGGIDWLHAIPNPENDDFGWAKFLNRIDALIMGRKTFETILSFGGDWPYPKPVFVLSNSIKTIPTSIKSKVQIISGPLNKIITDLNNKGFHNLYIDGGKTIQSFLKEDLIDEIIVTQIPILLGNGIPLFAKLSAPLNFEFIKTEVHLNALVQNHYRRKRDS